MPRLAELLGIDRRHAPWRERLASAIGGGLSIAVILWISRATVGADAGLIVASMGASAVLLFAVPHGPLSQPWQVLAGHLVSALIGVSCARVVPDPALGGALAVGLAILAMRLLGCVHPPGGATALSAVIGGPGVAALGYGYLVTPVLLNAVSILAVAVLFNLPLRWRRYPAAWHVPVPGEAAPQPPTPVRHGDLAYALREMDTFVDVAETDLERIYELAVQHADREPVAPDRVAAGQFYSNGRYGIDWQVREVIRVVPAGQEGRKVVDFRVAAGRGRGQPGKAGLLEFAQWARHRVVRSGDSWYRIDTKPEH